jgi:multidrug resistance efflux pump
MRKIMPVILILALSGGGTYWWYAQRQTQTANGLKGSGTIEATQINLGPEVSGRVVLVAVEEGQLVQAGQVLLQLEGALLTAQRAQAEAAVKTARAQRDQLVAGARQQQLDAARATISQTQALYSSAQAQFSGAQADLSKLLSGATYADIASAEAALAQSQAQFRSAQATQRQANEQHDKTMECRTVQLPDGTKKDICPALGTLEELARYSLNAANEALSAAEAGEKAAQARLNKLYSGATKDEINAVQARVDMARAQIDSAQAQMNMAQAQYDLLAAGASKEQIASAEAAIAQAEAALKAFDVQADKLTIRAPADATVLVRNVNVGEFLSPGASVIVLGKLDKLQITVYLPEDAYGRVKLGQTAQVTVDSHKGASFEGQVVRIADQAEFTPRNAQTVEGRRTTVYALKLDVPNPDGKLKPGMLADVSFE